MIASRILRLSLDWPCLLVAARNSDWEPDLGDVQDNGTLALSTHGVVIPAIAATFGIVEISFADVSRVNPDLDVTIDCPDGRIWVGALLEDNGLELVVPPGKVQLEVWWSAEDPPERMELRLTESDAAQHPS